MEPREATAHRPDPSLTRSILPFPFLSELQALRPHSQILMGKNTMMRKCIREYCERKGDNTWMVMHDKLVGNVGIVFTTGELSEVRAKIAEYVVPAPARVNSIAPLDVVVPAGPTGMEPSQTGFFQVLNIATKINKGAIEILSDVTVVQKDEKVSSSAATLLAKMGFTPFFYGLETLMVYDKGNMYDVKVLDIDDAKLGEMFKGVVSRTSRRSPSAPTTPPSPWFPTPSSTATRTSSPSPARRTTPSSRRRSSRRSSKRFRVGISTR